MSILNKYSVLHKLRPKSGTDTDAIDLYVVTGYDFGSNYSIIKIESATGDGGVTYNNGRLIESIPITGTLLSESLEDLNKKVIKIRKLADKKEVVFFVYPYKSDIRTNEFYIESVRFTPEQGKDTEIGFTLNLIEKRDANVKTTQVNIVNYVQSEALTELYNQRLLGT